MDNDCQPIIDTQRDWNKFKKLTARYLKESGGMTLGQAERLLDECLNEFRGLKDGTLREVRGL